MAAIRDVVKAVARSQYLQSVVLLDVSRYLPERVSGVQMAAAVLDVARPVR